MAGRCRWAVVAIAAIAALAACNETTQNSGSDAASIADSGGNGNRDATVTPTDATSDAGIEPDATTDEDAGGGGEDGGATDRGVTDAGVEPLDRDHLCDAFTTAFCDAITQCRCPLDVIARCEPELRALCTQQLLSADVIAKIDDGTITYDPYAARLFVDRLASTSTTCADPFTGLGWTVGDYYTIGGIFVGSLPAGATCTLSQGPLTPSECARGVCLEEGGDLQCLKLSMPGELCEGAFLCSDFSEPLDPALELSENLAAPCVPTSSTSSTAPILCSARQQDGSACSYDFECASHRCDQSACTARVIDGAMCMRDADCLHTSCDTDAMCEPGDLPVGMACDRSTACDSNLCVDQSCVPGVCAGLIR